MKKLFTLLTIALFLFVDKGHATDMKVTNAPYPYENGIYVESGTYLGKPCYTYSSYSIGWSGSEWDFGYGSDGEVDEVDCANYSTSSTCPTTGWGGCIVVTPQVLQVLYDGNRLIESIANDGSIAGAITIRLETFGTGQAFTGSNGDDFAGSKITFDSLPAGLTAHAIRQDSSITISFTGTATANNHANDAWLTIQFTDSAFVNGNAAGVLFSLDSVQVLFRQGLSVASSGGDYTTIAGAIAAASAFDVISISGETFTEAGLTTDKSLVFQGRGAGQTIMQAAASYNTATTRVLNITASDTVELRDLTLRYGKTNDDVGGGISSQNAPVNIYNCAITDNISTSTGSAYGGAIYCEAPLSIVASLIANNTAISPYNCWGGAIDCSQLYMVNTTLTGDSIQAGLTTNYGTAVYAIHGPVDIINCTIAGNASAGGGALTVDQAGFNLINSIVYGNTGGNDVVIMNGTTWNASDCIVGASSTAAINGTNYNVSTLDPLLSPLADNGGPTETMALNAGSFAIDEGATGDSIPTTDQRGYAAIGRRDIGAYEYGGFATGIKPLNSVSTMAVYPNPASDFINVIRSSEVNSIYTVTDLLGQTVLTGMLTTKNTVINTNSLSTGVYIFKAGSEQCKLLKE